MKQLLSPKDIVGSGLCIGCGSCVARQASPQIKMEFDGYGELKPTGPAAWYAQSSAFFTSTCPFSPGAKDEDEIAGDIFADALQKTETLGYFDASYVGHVAVEDFREQGSSGGMVTWVAAELLRRGLVDGVAHVIAADPASDGRLFKYHIARTEAEIRQGAKSRYYPIDLASVIREIRRTPGRYAVIGIPCFTKALHLLRLQDRLLQTRILFTLGLFCGHMKSARFVESIAFQAKVPIGEVESVDYRYKQPDRPANWYTARLTMKNGEAVTRDWWHLADGDWGAGFFMNNACNYCDDVVAETADVAFGDAWVEPYASDGRGTNVVIVRSKIVHQLIQDGIATGKLQLDPVDADFVTATQAAGFRQRREGLAYRLTWNKHGVQPRKRVLPASDQLTTRRKRIYRFRFFISTWCRRIFLLSVKINRLSLYVRWAKLAASVYHGLAYHQGKISEIRKRYQQLVKE